MTADKNNSKQGGAVVEGAGRAFAMDLLHPRYWGVWAGIGLMTLIRLLPRPLRNGLGSVLGRLYLKKDSNHRHYARVNLAICFPELSPQERYELLKKHFIRFFQVILDAPLFWWGNDAMVRKRVRVVGAEEADKAIKAGESVIFLVSHSLSIDAITTRLAIDYKMQGFYKPFKNPVIDWLIFRLRSKRGGRLAARGEGFKTVIRDLKRGMTLFYLSDEDLGRDGSVFAPFFGRPKATLAMLPRITSMTGAKVFPVYCHYLPESGSYQISILPALKDYPSGDAVKDACLLNRATENTVMICPEQYLWKLRYFKTQPDPDTKNPYRQARDGEFDLPL
ncbi:lipid A biosynthesis acyltransferase [Granulosicoccaceae sp. 1_MG-2023]|nr:lipid A biosynthesis acyltransferase [Granulosicoccaceae sp. 1_MG-2023]